METDLKISKEIDPHFFLNSFTTLGYLIHADPEKAYLFNSTMAQVYQYFLLNKKKALVPAGDELDFIGHYCYLLKVRHEEKLQVHTRIVWPGAARLLVVPFVLQMLIDNAIRVNRFSEEDPLIIQIVLKARSVEFIQNRVPPIHDPAALHFASMIDAHYGMCARKTILHRNSASGHSHILPLIHSA